MQSKQFEKLIQNYSQIDPRAPIIKSMKDFLEVERNLEEAKLEFDKAGRFKKGKFRKIVEENEIKIKIVEEKLVKSLLETFNGLYNEMMDQIRVIAIVAPNNVSSIRAIHSPLTSETKKVMKFSNDTFEQYAALLHTLRAETLKILEENKDLLSKYKKYVDIPLNEVTSSSRSTKESLELMNLNQLLNEKDVLENERKVLEKQRDDVERELRLRVTKEISTLDKDIQTANSLGIEVIERLQDNVATLRSELDRISSLSDLFAAENSLAQTKTEFLSSLRSEITNIRQEVDSQIGRLATVSKETKSFPEPPELDLSVQTSLELIQQVETIRGFEKKVLLSMKRLVDMNEFSAAIRAVEAKQIPIPRSLKDDAIEIAKKIHDSEDLTECTEFLVQYFNTSSEITETIREKLYEIINNEELKSVSGVFPPPPTINIETINPKLLIRQFEEIEKWQSSISSYLQNMTGEITRMIEQLGRAERFVEMNPEFKKELTLVMNKVVGEKDISTLIRLRKQFADIQETIFAFLFNLVNEVLQSPLITRISMLEEIDAISSDYRGGNPTITTLINKLEEIDDWKKKVQIFLKDLKQTDQTRVMAETSQIFEVELPQDYIARLQAAKDEVKHLVELEELIESHNKREQLREELKEAIRKRIRSLIDLMNTLNLDIVSEIGVSLDGDVPILKESLEKIYRWMESKKTDLQNEIDRSRANLRLFQSKFESGQIPYKPSDSLLTSVSEQGRPTPPKNDVTDLASDLHNLSDLTIRVTDLLGDNVRKDVRLFRESLSSARNLRSTINLPDPSVPDFTPGNIEQALTSLETLESWKDKSTNSLVDGLKNLKFPSIRVESVFDLTDARQICIEDLQRIPKNQSLQRFIDFLNEMEEMRLKIIDANNDLKAQISSITERSESLFGQRIEDYSESRQSEEIAEYSYAEVLQEWWNLTSHLQWQKEVLLTFIQNDIGYKLSILQELAPPHSEYFESTVSFLFDKSQGGKDKEIEEIMTDYRLIQERTIEFIEDDYRKFLQAGILPSIRVALPRIRERIKLPPRIMEIEQNIEKAITSQRDFFAIVGSANQLMSYYNEIVSELKVIAKDQSMLVQKEIKRLKEVEMDLSEFIPPEIHVFANMDEFGLAFEGEDKRPASIKDATDCFIAIDNLRTNPEVCGRIRDTSKEYVEEMRKAIDTIAAEYGINIGEQIPVIQEYLSEEFVKDISYNNLFSLTDLYSNLVTIRSDLIQLMRDLELDQQNKFEKTLEKKHSYYNVIKEIFDQNKSEMEAVFPLANFLSLREDFFNAGLGHMTDLLPNIRKGRGNWDETIKILNNWHRGLIMFIDDFKNLSDEENNRQYEEIRKNISNTYRSNDRIKTYFTSAVKQYIEVHTGRNLNVGSTKSESNESTE
ncbi:MAG: hypothetical protein ACXAC7_01770 [Candidatus Hodarchaeales archaeon]|jgi:hypothetical protein